MSGRARPGVPLLKKEVPARDRGCDRHDEERGQHAREPLLRDAEDAEDVARRHENDPAPEDAEPDERKIHTAPVRRGGAIAPLGARHAHGSMLRSRHDTYSKPPRPSSVYRPPRLRRVRRDGQRRDRSCYGTAPLCRHHAADGRERSRLLRKRQDGDELHPQHQRAGRARLVQGKVARLSLRTRELAGRSQLRSVRYRTTASKSSKYIRGPATEITSISTTCSTSN